MKRTVAAVIALLVVAGACSGGDEEEPASDGVPRAPVVADTAEVRDRLAALGVECDSFEVTPDAPLLYSERAFCDVDGERLVLSVFAPEYADGIEFYAGMIGGTTVTGPNWSVRSPSRDLARVVADGLGGRISEGDESGAVVG